MRAQPRALTVERRQVGHRCGLDVHGALDAACFRATCDAFLDATKAGARQIWIALPPGDPLPTPGVDALVRLTTLAYELGRSAVVIVAVGPRHGEPTLDVHERPRRRAACVSVGVTL
jgi:hypothetical protein